MRTRSHKISMQRLEDLVLLSVYIAVFSPIARTAEAVSYAANMVRYDLHVRNVRLAV